MPSTRRFTPIDQWADERHLLGVRGEHVALAYLTSCGWAIEAHRFRLGRHDIDLVIRKGNVVAFVEVKTRRGASCGGAVAAVGRRKQRAVSRAASLWVLRHGRPGEQYRFDVVAIEARGGRSSVEHVADAWRSESACSR